MLQFSSSQFAKSLLVSHLGEAKRIKEPERSGDSKLLRRVKWWWRSRLFDTIGWCFYWRFNCRCCCSAA
jgi:hypothetical protein